MRLRNLEIKGFKSFADQTVINFNEDVIGVVGPNGSGKSNIVDAIRWVLGEQKSKHLRLDKMTSVIFNGTKKRKPSGAASVSLTFENTKNLLPTEFSMVTITRILYRSGESEYRLNNVQCRLKDITSLFLDTGIGSNSYAIIALNMVDDLLNDKDNARRKMFEQAAGISKYKRRKHETLNKLKSTEADLERIEDLLFEIEGNLKSLEKQAKRTKKYYEIKKLYKELSLELAIFQTAAYKEDYQTISQRLTQEEDSYRQLEIQSREYEAKIEADKKNHLDYEKTLSDKQRELNVLVNAVREFENEKRLLEERSSFTKTNQEKLSSEIGNAKARIQQLEEELVDYRSRINEEKSREAVLEEALEEAETHLAKIRENHSSLKTDLDQYIQTQQTLEKEVFELEKQRAINDNQLGSLSTTLDLDKTEIEGRHGEIIALQTQLVQLTEKSSTQKTLVEDLETKEAARQAEVEKTEEEITVLNEKIANISRKLDAKQNEFKLTKSMVENLEGFPESIKFLAKNSEWNHKAPLLSDVIYVKEDYRVAIENYLDPYLNYYVVDNLEQAYKAVQLLHHRQKGKANFFLLDSFNTHVPKASNYGNAKRATELVEVEDKYRKLCNYLLANVFVVNDNISSVPQNIEEHVVILSQSGGFIKRKFSLSGGSVGLFEGKKIGRKKNLEVLEKAIGDLDRQRDQLTTELLELKSNLEELKQKDGKVSIDAEKEFFNELSNQKVSIETRLENFESFAKEVTEKIQNNQFRISELTEGNKLIARTLEEKKKIAEDAKEKLSDTDNTYREIANELNAASQSFNEKNITFIRQQNLVGTIQQELTFKENQAQELKDKLERDTQTIQNSSGEIQELVARITTIDASLVGQYQSRDAQSKDLSIAEQDYFKVRGQVTELEDTLRKNNRKFQDSQSLINQLKDKFNDLKLKMTSIGERLKIEFNMDINDVIDKEPNPEYNIEDLGEKVGKMKKRLDNYGEINPMAVEAYDEIKERYDTIITQRDDVVAAKSTLIETISEIETTATGQFMEAFEKVRLYFIDVFQSLFSEGDMADLILTNPDHPLDSPINITAKPKGKRPQSISQLSGGEKTLTATALLFALYLLKPAPFCIFDEVDAPLDDANIAKFNNIVKKFSKESQFIVVTHNKQTMSAVDVIYGVHMQEMGVSSVTPVDFRALDNQGNILEAVEG